MSTSPALIAARKTLTDVSPRYRRKDVPAPFLPHADYANALSIAIDGLLNTRLTATQLTLITEAVYAAHQMGATCGFPKPCS